MMHDEYGEWLMGFLLLFWAALVALLLVILRFSMTARRGGERPGPPERGGRLRRPLPREHPRGGMPVRKSENAVTPIPLRPGAEAAPGPRRLRES